VRDEPALRVSVYETRFYSIISFGGRALPAPVADFYLSHRMPELITMKMIPFTSIAALLLLAGAGCTSVKVLRK
jgi:hypothetical protein